MVPRDQKEVDMAEEYNEHPTLDRQTAGRPGAEHPQARDLGC